MIPRSAVPAAIAALAIAGLLPIAPAAASDHDNLEEGLPATVEDAFPIAYRGREIQGLFRYDHTDDDPEGSDLFRLEPRFEFGPLRNLQLAVAVPYRLGNASEADSGDVEVEALYNFNAEGVWLPAFAVAPGVSVPFNSDTDGFETTLKGIATKTLGASWERRRLHLNLDWTHKFERAAEERGDRYRVSVGYSQPWGSDVVVVADLVREQRLEEEVEYNFAEAGLRYQLTPLTLVTAGIGVGFGDESPDFRALVGFQHALTIFPLY